MSAENTKQRQTFGKTPQLSTHLLRLAASSGKRNVTFGVRPSVRLSACPVFFLTLIERAAQTQRDSPDGSSMRRGQRTFRPDIKEDGRTCLK